ncbi:MAG: MATE family efflux transporter [Peptococcaceae bacterium]|nr:MATE family efflux transporter [Peptococcaceae bacterium]
MSEDVFVTRRSGSVDLLTGTPWKKILQFAIPLIIGNLFQQLYNTVDAIIVGRYVGPVGLAAVGVSTPLLFLMVSIFMGVGLGAGVLVSQNFGARNREGLRKTLHTAILLALVVGIALSVIAIALVPHILRLLNTPEDTYAPALSYMVILFIGMAGQMLYNMTSGFMRGMGNSRMPLIILIISSFTNIVLDLIFVAPMGMGVAGAALATIISQIMSALIAVVALHRTNELTRISRDELKISWAITKDIVKLGVPTAIQQAVLSIGSMMVMGTLNTYGTITLAGYSAAMKVDMLAVMPIMSFGMSLTSFTGQNVGANQMDRVYQGAKHGIALSASIVLTFSALLLFFGKYALMMFTDDMATVEAGFQMMRIVVPFYLLMVLIQSLGAVMRGSGETVIPMWNSLTMSIFARLPLLYLLNATFMNPTAVYWSQVGGWLVGGIHIVYMYNKGNWKKKAFTRIEALRLDKERQAAAAAAAVLAK